MYYIQNFPTFWFSYSTPIEWNVNNKFNIIKYLSLGVRTLEHEVFNYLHLCCNH